MDAHHGLQRGSRSSARWEYDLGKNKRGHLCINRAQKPERWSLIAHQSKINLRRSAGSASAPGSHCFKNNTNHLSALSGGTVPCYIIQKKKEIVFTFSIYKLFPYYTVYLMHNKDLINTSALWIDPELRKVQTFKCCWKKIKKLKQTKTKKPTHNWCSS